MKRDRVAAAILPFLVACGQPGASTALHAQRAQADTDLHVKHVLLISVDGMHQKDLARYVAAHPSSTFAQLVGSGIEYTNAQITALDGSPSQPTDSVPGLLALVTGASSPTTGGWYDVAYARDLYPYSATAPCAGAPGTNIVLDEGIEQDNTQLWMNDADATPSHTPAVLRQRFDVTKLPWAKTAAGCTPVFPHQYILSNTIFEVAHAAGLHTAWSDKHLGYEMVGGKSDGLDDYFAPEINSNATSLIPGADGQNFITIWKNTEVYDGFKVDAIVNEINGNWSDTGLAGARDTAGAAPGTPAIFGMNFQALSVAQKDAWSGHGGYLDADATPNDGTADALDFIDASLGRMVAAINANHLASQTLIIVSAKHGQSPIDHSIVQRIPNGDVNALINSVSPLLAATTDDAAYYWLQDPSQAPAVAAALVAATQSGVPVNPMVDQIFTRQSPSYDVMFGTVDNPRTPDIVVKSKVGAIYSLNTAKWSEHGGFADDDSHVLLVMSNPSIRAKVISAPVRTRQVAPTILRALNLDIRQLDGVRKEGTQPLPQ